MTSFFWNVRGFNKHLKHSVVEEWVRSNNMSFGCILETRVKERKAEGILKKVFRDWSYLMNYECSQGGRIWLVWRRGVYYSGLQNRSVHHLFCEATGSGGVFLHLCLCDKFGRRKEGIVGGFVSSSRYHFILKQSLAYRG